MMNSLLPLQWLMACAGSLAVGLLVWLMLDGAARWLPALRTRRGVWLAAQCVVALAIALPFVPRGEQIRVTPQITLAASVATPAAAPASRAPADAAVDGDDEVSTWLTIPSMAALWLYIYLAGLTWAVVKQLRARRLWRELIASAEHLSPRALQEHGAFTADQLRQIAQRVLAVLRTDAAISPMLIGVRRPRLLLPAHLDMLSSEQQQMIIAHELHHWRVRDPLCLAIAALLQTLFWFNPVLRWMAKQMEWALELQCDQHVLTGRPQQQRKQYAAALLRQWSAVAPTGAAAFSGTAISARIRHMQQDGLPALGAAAAWLIAAAMAALLALGAMLQPALAFATPASEPPAPLVATPAATAATPEAWRAPVENIRITSFFGVMRGVLPTPHKGIDFAAKTGTPVHATAAGTIIAAGPIAENNGRYGTAVIIDHGSRQSLYAHLSSVNVKAGQQVQAGQRIGAAGATGFATGPHLHLEVRENGHQTDPAAMFTDLDADATPRALRIRRQQKG